VTVETQNVARLAGAAGSVVLLAAWGLLTVAVGGEPTASTWALGLALMFPVSVLLLGVSANGTPPRSGMEYAIGLLVAVAVASLAYLGVVLTNATLVRAVSDIGLVELAAGASGFAVLVVVLVYVDLRYVERPLSAATLEDRYLDDPVRAD
jgi:hypothetical protein